MPQTTEEHLELENDDDDKSDSEKNLDGEVSCFLFFIQCCRIFEQFSGRISVFAGVITNINFCFPFY